jgi:hypothetical protein
MELSLQTFMWLRDKGNLSSQFASPSTYNQGMMSVSTDGMQDIASGLPLVRVLHHYCCHRFDAPEELLPLTPTPASSSGKSLQRFVSLVAARTHNWEVVRKITCGALGYNIPVEQLEVVQKQGDALEALLIVKTIYDLVRAHRGKEKISQCKHKMLSDDTHVLEVKMLLENKSVAPSKKIKIVATASPTKATRSPLKRFQSPTKTSSKTSLK